MHVHLKVATFPWSPDAFHLFIDTTHMETPYGIACCKCPFYIQPTLKLKSGGGSIYMVWPIKIKYVVQLGFLFERLLACFFSIIRIFYKQKNFRRSKSRGSNVGQLDGDQMKTLASLIVPLLNTGPLSLFHTCINDSLGECFICGYVVPFSNRNSDGA